MNYHFILIKNNTNNTYHPLIIEKDICNDEVYNFERSHINLFENECIVIEDIILDANRNYLIQDLDTGKFGYYSVGNPIIIFENQEEIEQDIYHFYFMEFS